MFSAFLVLSGWLISAVLVESVDTCYAPEYTFELNAGHQLVRKANGLSLEEAGYIDDRQIKTMPALYDFLERAGVDFDPVRYTDSRIGLAFSGGGYRAMLCGAGQISALDNRMSHGSILSGLLQASTYITGTSGGSWLIGSIYANNFSSIEDILHNRRIWNLAVPLFLSPSEPDGCGTFQHLTSILKHVATKKVKGFPVSVTDLWGLGLYEQMVDSTEGIQAWSDMMNDPWYLERDAPYPIITLTDRMPPWERPGITSRMFEVTPSEIGSFDENLKMFTSLRYLGTPAYKGSTLLDSSLSVTGYDHPAFVLGVASSLFDQAFITFVDKIANPEITSKLRQFMEHFLSPPIFRDVGVIGPNPFLGMKDSTGSTMVSPYYYVADGGETEQNIPLLPHLLPERQVDAVLAVDNSGANSEEGWPDGSSLYNSYLRQFKVPGSPAMAHVPEKDEFMESGFSKLPGFFGCYANQLEPLMERTGQTVVPPVVIYIPNAPYSTYSNTSTFQLTYSRDEILDIIDNGFEVATMGNGTVDDEWAACVGCAVTQRSRERRGDSISPQCQRCFARYCYVPDME